MEMLSKKLQVSLISTCTLNSLATFSHLFPPISFEVYKTIFASLPEDTLGQRIRKVRKQHNMDRIQFGKSIGHHESSIQSWEEDALYPIPNSIKDICNFLNIDIKYFGDYYYWHFNHPEEKFKEWKTCNEYSFSECAKIFNVTDSTLKRLCNGRQSLSYDMYKKFKDKGIFKKHHKRLIKEYDHIPSALRTWKNANNYTLSDCARVLNTSTATIKRLLRGNYMPYRTIYLKLKEHKII